MLFFQEREILITILGVISIIVIIFLAFALPTQDTSLIGSPQNLIHDQGGFANIRFSFTATNRIFLIFHFGYLAFLLIGSPAARIQREFIPLSIIITTLITVGVSITPVIFGIMFFQPAVLLGAVLISGTNSDQYKGSFRFVIYQIIGMVFLILAGWSLSAGPEMLENPGDITRSIIFFWISLSCLFAIFPMHSWVTMTSEKTNLYSMLFIFVSFFGGYIFTMLSFINSFDWFFSGERLIPLLHIAGFLLITTGGTGAAFQKDLGRLFGYAFLMEVGFCLSGVAIQVDGLLLFQIPRLFILSLWGLGLSILSSHSKDLSLETIEGMANQLPLVSSVLILAPFSLAGVPLLAGFPFLLDLFSLISETSTTLVFWIFIGCIGIFIGSVRSFSALIRNLDVQQLHVNENNLQITILTTGIIILLSLGIVPKWVVTAITELYESLVKLLL
jgi:formate hydrogenlyase subunit 3/multisubunit Na+/H+ antiporter MnhD subunit